MKTTIYVPDELWAQAVSSQPGANPSQVVQAGLRLLAPGGGRAGYATDPPPEVAAGVREAATRLREQATQLFIRGYRSGVRVGQAMSWQRLESFVEYSQGDVRRWLNGHADEPFIRRPPENPDDLDIEGTIWEHWDELTADHQGFIRVLDEEFGVSPWSSPTRSVPVLEGLKQALLDLWDATRRPEAESGLEAEPGVEHAPTPRRLS